MAIADPARDLWRIEQLPARGRGVVAARDLPASTLLHKVAPTAFVVDDARLGEHCCVCMARTGAAECAPCARCGFGGLCAACAGAPARRRVHELECASLERLRSSGMDLRGDTRALRLLVRLLLRMRAARLGEPPARWWPVDASWSDVGSLAELVGLEDLNESDSEGGDGCDDPTTAEPGAFAQRAQYERAADAEASMPLEHKLQMIAQQARFVVDSDCRLGHAAAVRLLGQLCLNCHEIVDAEALEREIGLGIFPPLAAFNHACAPNVHMHTSADGCLCARLVLPVRAGDELTICYVDPYQPRATRQRQLRAGYRFDCTCERCADEAVSARAEDDELGAALAMSLIHD